MDNTRAQEAFRKKISRRSVFRLFLFRKLPLAWLAGLKLRALDGNTCTVSVPYRWLTQNPFRSIYFAAMSMAAEMSTGLLSMMAIQGNDPPLSMLVTGLEAEFIKKADTTIYFTCSDGEAIWQSVERAVKTGEGVTVRTKSEGKNSEGIVVAIFYISWSFKVRTKKG